jgi:hemerythrin-like metal-binding protein
MPFISWSSQLEVPNDTINQQHKKLIQKVNELHDAFYAGKADPAGVMMFLVNYIAEHFATEEKLMVQYDYPATEAHRVAHQELRNDVTDRAQAYIGGADIDPEELLQFLKGWLTNHILGMDKQLAEFVRQQ